MPMAVSMPMAVPMRGPVPVAPDPMRWIHVPDAQVEVVERPGPPVPPPMRPEADTPAGVVRDVRGIVMVIGAMPVPVSVPVRMRGCGDRREGQQDGRRAGEIAELPVHRWSAPVWRSLRATFAHRR